MAAAYEEVPFSELLHRPAATTGRLDQVRALRLRRRDADDLALVRVDQMERDGSVVDFAAQVLGRLVHSEHIDTVRQVLRDVLPWLRFLPEPEFESFVGDLTETAQAAAAIDNLTPISTLLVQWRHTAELYADPDLLARVTREPTEDLGPVGPPL